MRFNPKSSTLKSFVGEITPTEAQEILDKYNTDPETGESTNFRTLRTARAEKYSSDMRKKDWVPGVSTIDFDTDGILINGQHTLQGCVLAGKPITVTIRVGLDDRAVQVIDSGLSRREADGLKCEAVFTAVGRWMFEASEWQKTPGRLQMLKFYEKHRPAIEFVTNTCAKGRVAKGVRIGPVLAPIARAWYTENRDKLERFLRILSTGMTDGGVHVNDVLEHRTWLVGGGPVRGDRRTGAYWRTERVLRNFLDNRTVQLVKPATEELFPITKS